MIDLTLLMKNLRYTFKDIDLLRQALTHRSLSPHHNERLEFLGDAVLSLVISGELYHKHANASEGALTRMRASVVNGEVLAKLAKDFKLDEYLCLGSSEKKSGARPSLLSDALEAMIGAIYLDAGFETCKRCVLSWYGEKVDDLSKLMVKKDAKSSLQEWLQAHNFPLPQYVIQVSGKDHQQTFLAKCQVKGLPYCTRGKGNTRRSAEQGAAARFLEYLDEW